MAGRYAHAKQFNRHRRQWRVLRTRLGRIIRDISRKIAGQRALQEAFAWPLARTSQIRSQLRRAENLLRLVSLGIRRSIWVNAQILRFTQPHCASAYHYQERSELIGSAFCKYSSTRCNASAKGSSATKVRPNSP